MGEEVSQEEEQEEGRENVNPGADPRLAHVVSVSERKERTRRGERAGREKRGMSSLSMG